MLNQVQHDVVPGKLNSLVVLPLLVRTLPFLYNDFSMDVLVVGSRGSELALCQTRQVVDQLRMINPGLTCRIETIKTTGDRMLDVSLAEVGEKGLFVKEIEHALLDGRIDFAVHSAKDLPSESADGLCVAAFTERENPADALVSNLGCMCDLPSGAVIGTGSLRRRAQILHARPDLRVKDIRGNLNTRLAKLDGSEYDGIVVALAGLRRMGWAERAAEVLSCDMCLPAAGQGALAVQCRAGDAVESHLRRLDHAQTSRCIRAERVLISELAAGCRTPVAALALESSGKTELRARVASADGTQVVSRSAVGDSDSAEQAAKRLARELLESPARDILDDLRRSTMVKGTGAA